jgi:hypothetical protein
LLNRFVQDAKAMIAERGAVLEFSAQRRRQYAWRFGFKVFDEVSHSCGRYEPSRGEHDSVKQASRRPKQNQNGRYRAGNKQVGHDDVPHWPTDVGAFSLSVGLSFENSSKLPLQHRRNVLFGKHLTLVPFFPWCRPSRNTLFRHLEALDVL